MALILETLTAHQLGDWSKLLGQIDIHLPERLSDLAWPPDTDRALQITQNHQLVGAVFLDPDYEGMEELGCYISLPHLPSGISRLEGLLEEITSHIRRYWPDRKFFLQMELDPDIQISLEAAGYEMGFGFRQFKLDQNPTSSSAPDVEMRPFEEQHMSEYLSCWACGFEALRRRIDLKPYLWALEYSQTARAEMDPFITSGQFRSYWQGTLLVGLAWHKRNFIENIVVHPDHQGQGIGTAIMEDLYRTISGETLFLDVVLENPDAIRFYEKCGFHALNDSGLFWPTAR